MKINVIKLSIVSLILFFFWGCNKENWIEIETTNNHCPQIGESMGIISDVEGEIKPFGKNEYIIVVKEVLGYSEMPLYPCNISFSDVKEEHKIIISGEVYFYEGQNNDSVAISLGAQPILISNAKIYK